MPQVDNASILKGLQAKNWELLVSTEFLEIIPSHCFIFGRNSQDLGSLFAST